MEIRWLMACIDRPAAEFDAAVDFYAAATASRPSPPWGPHGELVTLLPPDGDPHLSVQRLGDGAGGVHLDVHVDDAAAGRAALVAAGGEVVAEHPTHTVARSPSGFVICIVADPNTPTRTSPVSTESAGGLLLDQVCIDVPHDAFAAEQDFWRAFTGYDVNWYGVYPYARVSVPAEQPLRLLIQQRDDADGPARGHVDFACTDRVAAASWLADRGAAIVREDRVWVVLADPAGHELCATGRDPVTGVVPD